MKKAKIMLMSIAVLAVVGGALAFKSNKNFNNFYKINGAGNSCDVLVRIQSTTTDIAEDGTKFDYTTTTAAPHTPDQEGNICGPLTLKVSE